VDIYFFTVSVSNNNLRLYSLLDTSHAVQKSQDFKIGTVLNNKISNNQILNKCIIGEKRTLENTF